MVSTQYKNAGSAPVGEQAPVMSAPDIPDPLELSPFQYAMAEKRAEQSKRKNDLGTIMAAASQGIGPEELSRERDRADLYNRSMSMAEQTMQASDEEFEEILNRLDSMAPEDAPMLVRSGVDRYDQIAAGIAMLMDKKHAAGYASVPGMMRDQRDAQTNTDLMNQFKVRAANSATVRDGLEKRLGYAELRRRQASGALFDTVQKRDTAEVEAQTDARNHAQSLETIGKQQQGRMTLEQMKQAGKLDLKRVDFLKSSLRLLSPEARAKTMADAIAASGGHVSAEMEEAWGQLSEEEKLKVARAGGIEADTEGQIIKNNVDRKWADKTAEAKFNKIVADTGVSEKRAAKLAKEVEAFDEITQAALAKSWAAVDNYTSLASDREAKRAFDQSKQRDEMVKAFATVSKDGLSALSTRAGELRQHNKVLLEEKAAAKDVDAKKRIQDQIDYNNVRINATQNAYKELYDDYQEAQKSLGSGGGAGASSAPASLPPSEKAKARKQWMDSNAKGRANLEAFWRENYPGQKAPWEK